MDARPQWSSIGAPLQKKIADRWCSFGPYYAMFPVSFARKIVSNYTQPGDFVLDPFCGRGTAIFCAGEVGREGLGIEINPVAWLYSRVKTNPADRIRDKIAASKRKGLWVGGMAPLGYDTRDRKITVNESEAMMHIACCFPQKCL